MDLVQTEVSDIGRDNTNKALLNTNNSALSAYKLKKQKQNEINTLKEEVDNMKNDISDIKNMLSKLVEKL
jgi:hypothetical protein